jgi:hypothetical protein
MWGSRGVRKNLVIRLALSFVKNYSNFFIFLKIKNKRAAIEI